MTDRDMYTHGSDGRVCLLMEDGEWWWPVAAGEAYPCERPHGRPQPTRWWRVIDMDGEVWAESSDEDEVRGRARSYDTLQRLYQLENGAHEWRDEG